MSIYCSIVKGALEMFSLMAEKCLDAMAEKLTLFWKLLRSQFKGSSKLTVALLESLLLYCVCMDLEVAF